MNTFVEKIKMDLLYSMDSLGKEFQELETYRENYNQLKKIPLFEKLSKKNKTLKEKLKN